jgi:hypothetical protein
MQPPERNAAASQINDDLPEETRDIALNTYRSLRTGIVVMIVMLAAALLIERWPAPCWQTSISAYYFTTAHSIFVAALCALGALLIVYEGSSDTEDAFLNLAGVLAFVVAMVPTSRPPFMCGTNPLPEFGLTHMIANNVSSVVIALGTAQLGYWILAKKKSNSSRKSSFLGFVGSVVFWSVILVGLLTLIFFRQQFDSFAHYTAAVIMFIAIIVTVVITAFLSERQEKAKSPHRGRYHFFYTVIAWGMIGTLVGVIALHFTLGAWNHWVILIETLLILEFAAYWAIQTVELWNTLDRKELLSAPDQRLLSKGRKRRTPKTLAPPELAPSKPPRAEQVLRAL